MRRALSWVQDWQHSHLIPHYFLNQHRQQGGSLECILPGTWNHLSNHHLETKESEHNEQSSPHTFPLNRNGRIMYVHLLTSAPRKPRIAFLALSAHGEQSQDGLSSMPRNALCHYPALAGCNAARPWKLSTLIFSFSRATWQHLEKPWFSPSWSSSECGQKYYSYSIISQDQDLKLILRM